MSIRTYRVTCLACPHQAEGELNDNRGFYFRARHNQWALSIGTSIPNAIHNASQGYYIASGTDPHGRLSYGDTQDEARLLITAIFNAIDPSPFR